MGGSYLAAAFGAPVLKRCEAWRLRVVGGWGGGQGPPFLSL